MPGYFNLIGGAQQRKKETIYSHTAVDLASGPDLRVLVNKGVFEEKGNLVIRNIEADRKKIINK